MQRIVFEPTHSSPEALAEKIRQGQAYWEPVVRAAGWVLQ
jgi:tripartite-type tricarboxylate transporter receptor subunit TctC